MKLRTVSERKVKYDHVPWGGLRSLVQNMFFFVKKFVFGLPEQLIMQKVFSFCPCKLQFSLNSFSVHNTSTDKLFCKILGIQKSITFFCTEYFMEILV